MERNSDFVTNFLKSSNKNGEKTKVIVRTFDIPARNKSKLCDVSQFPGCQRNLTSPFKSGTEYMRNSKPSPYVVPPVTRVYPGRKSKINQAVTTQKSASVVLPPSVPQKIPDMNFISSTVPLVVSLTKSQEVSQSVLPEHTVFVVPPKAEKERTPKVDLPRKLAHVSQKITLNNVPDGLFGDSAEIVDSQLINGKKVFILKTKKNSSKLEKALINSPKNSCFDLKKQYEAIPPIKQQPSVIQTGPDVSGLIEVKNVNFYSLHIPSNKSNNLIMAQVPSLDGMWGESERESDRRDTDKLGMHCVRDQSNCMKLDSLKMGANGCKGTKGKEHCHVELSKESEVDFEGKIVLVPNHKIVKYMDTNASHSTLKQKLIPADLDNSPIGHISEGLTSENIKPKKLSNTNVELQIVTASNEKNTNVILDSVQNPDQLCMIDAPNHILDPNNDTSEYSLPNLKQNVNANVSVMLKPNMNDDLYRKREKIALQYQQETQKAKLLPRVLKTFQRSAKTVHVVESATQTSLFSLVEPGRLIEMQVKESTNDCQSLELNGTHFDPAKQKLLMSTFQNSNEVAMNSIDSSVSSQNNYTVPSVRKSTEEEMYSVSSKRMRIDSRDNSLLNSSTDVFVCSDLTADDQEDIYTLSAQVNVSSIDQQKKNTTGPQNIEDGFMLACKKLTEKFSNINLKIIQKKVVQRAYMDFKNSLIQDDDGNVPLHHAVMDKDVKKVRKQLHILSAQKETVNVKNNKGETPLHLAVYYGANEIIQDLIKWRADLSLQDNRGDTALHLVILWGDETCFNIIMKYVGFKNPVLDKPNDNGYSPLHLCALNNKENEAKTLIENGADINLRDRKSGRSPLFHAVERGYHKLCRILVDLGASTTTPNFSGQNPLNASEMNLGAAGTEKCAEEELYASLCQGLQQTTVDQNYLYERGGNYQNQMNVNVLGVDGMEQDNEISLNLLNGNCEKLHMSKSVEIYKYSNS